MWERSELKTLAREALKGNYWKAFLVSLVILLATGKGSSIRDNDVREFIVNHPDYFIIIVAVFILVIAYRILLGYSLEVGSIKYYVQLCQYKNTQGCYSFAFDSTNYKGIISTMFLMNVYAALWTLLFIIPGIIKAFSYKMVPYILADNPNMGANEAITLSRKMMDGNKFNSFVLDLSFIGWYIVGLLALVVGILFVNPYYDATNAQLYLVLRKNALDNRTCSYEDLNIHRDYNEYDGYYNQDEN